MSPVTRYDGSRLTDRALVLTPAKRERAEVSVVPLRTEGLREAPPGHEVVLDEHLGFQRPATNFAAVAAEKSDRAFARPVGGVRLSDKVSSRVAEVEVVERKSGIRTGDIEAGCVLVSRDEVHQADIIDEGNEFASRVRAVVPRAHVEPDSSDGRQ